MAAAAIRALAGRTALVTGSTSGIGLGIARSLAAAGADIVLHGFIDHAAGQKLVSDFSEEFRVQASLAKHDVATAKGVEQLFEFAEKMRGAVDVVVNNAGIQHISPVESFSPEKWDQIMAINLSAPFHATRLALPGMRARKWGRIINVASVHGHVASVNKSAYVAAKHGLIGFTKATALETAGSGVTVNAICPGWVLTPLVQAQVELRAKQRGLDLAKAQAELLLEKQPSGQFVQTSDLGAAAVFMCSEAAAQMTGVSLTLDGGWTAQ